MPDPSMTESLAALSRFFVGDATLQDTLYRVAELTVQAVSPSDFVGLTIIVEGQKRTAVFTDEASPEIDQAQYDTGDGPCLDAFANLQVHRVESTHEDGPWPAFRDAAAAHGIGSTLSVPMIVDQRAVGAMNLYARRERAFGPAETQAAEVFAAQAAIVLANAQAYWDARGLSERLGQAMKSRAVIEQAKGMLMSAQHCDEDAAFELLVKASQRENVKLRDIAERIVRNATSGDVERGS